MPEIQHTVPSRPHGGDSRLVLALVLAAGALGWLFIGAKSLDLDEAYSVALARQGWPTFFRIVTTQDPNMSLYYLLLRLWLGLGHSEPALRAFSLLASVAAIPVVYALGVHLFDRRSGLIAAFLLSFNALQVKYAQDTRSYSLVMLLSAASSLLYARGIQRPSAAVWAGYALTAALAVYSHFFAAFVVVAQWVSLCWLPTRAVPRRWVTPALLALAGLLVPLAAVLLHRDVAHMARAYPRAELSYIPGVFYALSGSYGRLRYPSATGIALMLLYAALCAAAILKAARAGAFRAPSLDRWRYGFPLTWLLLPVPLAYGLSLYKTAFLIFYFIVCLPAAVLLAAVGAAVLRPTPLRAAALAAVLLLGIHETSVYYMNRQDREDFRDATATLLALAHPGDALLFYAPYGRDGFEYYRDRSPHAAYVVILGHWQDAVPRYPRVWLFVNSGYDVRAIEGALAQQYPVSRTWTYPGIQLVLYSRAPSAVGPPTPFAAVAGGARPSAVARALGVGRPFAGQIRPHHRHAGRDSGSDGPGRNVASHDRACADHGPRADAHTVQYDHADAQPHVVFDDDGTARLQRLGGDRLPGGHAVIVRIERAVL
jgi:mannosyltransferase